MARIAAIGRMTAAVLDAQQLVDALIELVVAHGRDVEADHVQRLDRWLVVERGRDQWRSTDVVACRDDQRVAGVGRLEVLDVVGEVGNPAGQVTVGCIDACLIVGG
jgi:hypothetical protein